MRIAIAELESISPYGQNKFVDVPKQNKELADDYEKRTWRERSHYDAKTRECYIPATCFKACIRDAAKFLSAQIPGKGKSTWTKHFKAGIMVVDNLPLRVKVEDIKGHWQLVPSGGGGNPNGPKVQKCFPCFQSWSGTIQFYIIDDLITEEAFEYHLGQAGSLIGIGVYRPQNGGIWGRFKVKSCKISKKKE